MKEPRRTFLPATGRAWLLPFYDPFVKLLGGDAIRAELLEQADIRPHQRILDIGCGTGSLFIELRRLHCGLHQLHAMTLGGEPDGTDQAHVPCPNDRDRLC